MGTYSSRPNTTEHAANLRRLTDPEPGSGASCRHTRVSAARRFQIACGVLSLVTLGAALLGLPEVTNLAAGKHHSEIALFYKQIPANDISERVPQTPSASGFISSARVFDPKFSIDPEQGFLVRALETSHDSAQLLRVQGPGRCWNPHPGPFRSWNGMQNGCLIQVWRQWQDGCTHFQWFNTCYNAWDPQINWTYCVH
jgi:hypothetical protein